MPDKSYLQVTTVYDFLKSADCLGLLKSPDVITATTAIVDKVGGGGGENNYQL